MFKRVLGVGACIGAMVAPLPSMAANCADRTMVVERLKSKYSESFAGGGLQATRTTQTVVEVWASEETGTFTVILTRPDGLACIVATGTDWYQGELTHQPAETES